MDKKQDLEKRLDAFDKKLADAAAKFEFKKSLHDGHKLTKNDLQVRYQVLKTALDEQVGDIEAHGRHVSALEKDLLIWLNKH
jgi:hypothetical protein